MRFLSFLTDLSRYFLTSHLSQTLHTQPIHIPHLIFSPNHAFFIYNDLISLLYHAFHWFWPKFWVFKKFLGFFKIDEVFAKFLGWVLFKWSCMLIHCITFAFSQCFMHFRCVFYMLKWCVLVGLDWAEPMMFLLLHVTCSCISTIFFLKNFFLILNVLVLFCLSFSLFLSFN